MGRTLLKENRPIATRGVLSAARPKYSERDFVTS